jgi:hypothetical protein
MAVDTPADEREYFGLMAWWVERVVTLTGADRVTAWSQYTPIVGMVTPADWQSIRAAVEHREVVDTVFRATLVARSLRPLRTPSCFWHDLEDDGHQVRIHFSNHEGPGVLSPSRRPRRRAELAATLDDARRAAPHLERIRGGSWLYHLPSYRALFPPSFLARAVPADPRTEVTRVALWGTVPPRRQDLVSAPHGPRFIDAARDASSIDELFEVFPLKKLDVVGPCQ